jgi:uncharacterized protein (TIGR00304 family)
LDLLLAGTIVMLIGFAIILVASLGSSRPGNEERKTEVGGGGVVMIGPIPIIFGSDTRWVVVAIVLAIVLMVLSLVFYNW